MSLILSAFSDEYAESLGDQITGLKKFGIRYTELRFVGGKNVADLRADEVKEIKKQLDDGGIKVSAIGSPIGKIKLDADMKEHNEKAKRVFEAANILNVKNIRVFSFYAPDGERIENCFSRVADKLGEIVKTAENFGVTLCHENEAGIYGETPERCLEILEHFGGRMKAVFDMGNFVLDGCDPLSAYETLKPHVEYFHIKDALKVGAIVPAGKGEARIKEILDDRKKTTEKDTFITLEPHLQTFSGLNALVGKSFDNPYKYENSRESFADAVKCLKELL